MAVKLSNQFYIYICCFVISFFTTRPHYLQCRALY